MAEGRLRLTERDLTLLSFAAEHRLILAAHVQSLLDVSPTVAYRRLHALSESGYLTRRTYFHHEPSCYQIRRIGLSALGSPGAPPRIDLNCYTHDVGVAWLWLAAHAGRFGAMREVLSERRLRSADGMPDRCGEPLAVRLGGYGPRGTPRLHYPDLLLITPEGRRIAVELELSAKGRARRETILSGYAFDGRVNAVLYLVQRTSIARSLAGSARRLGIANLVHVQRVRWSATQRDAISPASSRVRSRLPEDSRRQRSTAAGERVH